ncbi:MAG: hypothetical protein QXF52_01520 [Thermoproteota archaeon]
MGEIKVSSGRDYRGLFKKVAGILLTVSLVWLGFSAWLFTMSVYDNMYSVKSGVSYLNIMFLNGNLFTALGVLMGIAVLNPFLWHSVLKRRFKAAAWPQGDLTVLELTRTVFSLLRFIVSAVFIGFFLFWYPSLTYDVTSPIFRLA